MYFKAPVLHTFSLPLPLLVSVFSVYSTNIYCVCSVSQCTTVHRQTLSPGAHVIVGEKRTGKQVSDGDESCGGRLNGGKVVESGWVVREAVSGAVT